jgi:hypothetical protein
MSDVGKMGAMERRVVIPRHATVVGMRRLLWTVFRAALVIAVLAVVREILLDRAPQRAIPARGGEPVIGSLDTWPAVPRKPAAS